MTNVLGVVTWIQWVWCQSMLSYNKDWMWRHMQFIWCHICCVCYYIYNGGYMINNQDVNADRVDVLSDITSGCDVRYNSFDIMNRVFWCHKSWVRCHILCTACPIYSGCVIINTVCVISSIQWVWSHRYRHGGCDVRYSGCIVLTLCLWCQIEFIYIHKHTGYYVTDIMAVMSQV